MDRRFAEEAAIGNVDLKVNLFRVFFFGVALWNMYLISDVCVVLGRLRVRHDNSVPWTEIRTIFERRLELSVKIDNSLLYREN